MPERLAGSAAAGVALGLLASRLLFLQAATLIPWALAGLLIGALCRSSREALAAGAVYGFALGFSFTASGYAGADPILGKLPFFALLGAVSAVFGAALGVAGLWLARRIRPSSA